MTGHALSQYRIVGLQPIANVGYHHPDMPLLIVFEYCADPHRDRLELYPFSHRQ